MTDAFVTHLGVEGDVASPGVDELSDDLIDRADHQMNVDGGSDPVRPQCLADHRPDGQVGNVVVVHDVEVDDVGAGSEDVVDFLAKASEISREDRGSDQVIIHLGAPHIELGSGGGRRGVALEGEFGCWRRVKLKELQI